MRLGRVCRMLFGLVFVGSVMQPVPPSAPIDAARAAPTESSVRLGDSKPLLLLNGQPFMPIGVTYHFTRHQTSWESDLTQMVDMGLNTVRIDLGWKDVEPYWQGFYRFSVLDRFLDLAYFHGLKVVPVLTYATQDYNTPLWFWLTQKDWQVKRADGSTMLGDYPSINNPAYRLAFADYVKATVEHIRDHPALLAYQVLNEPHYSQAELGDYNQHTIERYRVWLQERYGTIDVLNEAWQSRYVSWDRVQPERMPPVEDVLVDPHAARWADWRQFTYQNLAEFVELMSSIVREVDAQHAILIAEMSWWWWGEQPYTGVSPTEVYRSADVIGFDIYPARVDDQHYLTLNADMLSRFWGKPVWLTEFNKRDGKPTASELSEFVQRAIEGGATGVFFFEWRDNVLDGGRYGLLDALGQRKPQYEGFQNVARWLKDNEVRILDAKSWQPDILVIWPSKRVGEARGANGPAQELYRLARRLIEQGLRVGIVADIRLALDAAKQPPRPPQRTGGILMYPYND